ncbi:MAG TPA: type II toxin-antitoxin system YafQ family toxin [Thermoanaerobaculia bacterium]|nr:type II toxin-antitoxin system YafQ family toxin [Thermoanaerobaculia bacterium]
MRELLWSNTFRRALRRMLKRQPHVRGDIEATLRLLQVDPFAAQLATHKLKGRLAGTWACSAGYDLRILFEFVRNLEREEEDLYLIEIGTHDEVY